MKRTLAVVAGLASTAGRALAHSGHGGHAGGTGPDLALPAALLVGGVLVLGTSFYLDRAGELDGRWADVGTLVGVVGLLAGLALALV